MAKLFLMGFKMMVDPSDDSLLSTESVIRLQQPQLSIIQNVILANDILRKCITHAVINQSLIVHKTYKKT